MQTVQINKSIYPTTNTKLAATLLTLGIPFADASSPASNIYTDEKPYRPGAPGVVTYHLASQTEDGLKAGELAASFEAMAADRELDQLVAEIVQSSPELGARLLTLLPLALAAYGRAFLENRERLLDLWKRVIPMVHLKKSETSFVLVSRNASPATRARLGINS